MLVRFLALLLPLLAFGCDDPGPTVATPAAASPDASAPSKVDDADPPPADDRDPVAPSQADAERSRLPDALASPPRPREPQGPASVVVSVERQWLELRRGGVPVRGWPISTASRGTGSEAGSSRTPLGRHRIAERIGDGAPLGAIFKSRRDTGQIAEIFTDQTDVDVDHVTTRILWLDGLEPGVNSGPGVDSKARYIYIHGTPEEGLIGQPASHGCVRMRNADVVELFDLVEVGTPVTIE